MPPDRQQIADEVARVLRGRHENDDGPCDACQADEDWLLPRLLPLIDRVAADAAADAVQAAADELEAEAVVARGPVEQLARSGKFAAAHFLTARATSLRPSPVVTVREEQP